MSAEVVILSPGTQEALATATERWAAYVAVQVAAPGSAHASLEESRDEWLSAVVQAIAHIESDRRISREALRAVRVG